MMEPPIGFITLCEAVDAVGRALFGVNWQYAVPLTDQAEADIHESVIAAIAQGCEAGEIAAGYRKWNGAADDLDRSEWQKPCWRNYFMTGTIDLDLPLIDVNGRPNQFGHMARCTREIFVRKDSLKQFMASLAPAATDRRPLRNASVEEIRAEIRAVYDEAGEPNIKVMADLVEPRLRARGLHTSKNYIMEIGAEPEFLARRRRPGKTKASERRQ
jgi:hypothetical protein